jgi:hypothetical protein
VAGATSKSGWKDHHAPKVGAVSPVLLHGIYPNNKKQKVILCFVISNCGPVCGLFVGVAVGKGYEILNMPLLKFFLV